MVVERGREGEDMEIERLMQSGGRRERERERERERSRDRREEGRDRGGEGDR